MASIITPTTSLTHGIFSPEKNAMNGSRFVRHVSYGNSTISNIMELMQNRLTC